MADNWTELKRRYSRMSDGELTRLFEQQTELTPEAREVLYQVVSERNLHGIPARAADPDDPDQFVRVHQQHDLGSLLFLKQALESLDIDAQIEDQDTHTLAWFIEHQMDGLSLFVRLRDVDAARQVIAHPFAEESEAQED